jgi:hypothetical protein
MVDDLAGDGDDAAGRSVGGEGEERNLGFWVLGVLGFRMRGAGRSSFARVRRGLEEGQSKS